MKTKEYKEKINWGSIKKKCPKSLNLFIQSKYFNKKLLTNKYFHNDLRILYDFFDDYKILLSTSSKSGIFYTATITANKFIGSVYEDSEYTNRLLAEVDLFETAFEILEKKLNNKGIDPEIKEAIKLYNQIKSIGKKYKNQDDFKDSLAYKMMQNIRIRAMLSGNTTVFLNKTK